MVHHRRSHVHLLLALALAPVLLIGTSGADELHYGLEKRRVASIQLRGNEHFEDDRLEALLPFQGPRWYQLNTSSYDEDQLRFGLAGIRDFYRRNGFHDVEVGVDSVVTKAGGDRIYIQVEEGERTTMGNVSFQHPAPLDETELMALLVHPPGSAAPFRDADLGQDVYRIRTAYVAEGHLAARIDLSLTRRSREIDAEYTIDAGPEYSVREVRIVGNEGIARNLIQREVRLEPGDRFRLEAIARTEEELFETGWFRDVSFTPTELDTAAATAVMVLRVVERPTAFYEIGVGFGDEDQVRGALAWGTKNVFGTGTGLTLRARLLAGRDDIVLTDDRDLLFDYEGELLYRYRHILGTSLDLRANAFLRRESRGELGLALRRTGLLLNTTLYSGRHTTAEIEGSLQRIRKTILDAVPADARDDVEILGLESATTRSLSLIWAWDSRNDPFQPRRGTLRQALLQTAGGPLIGGDNHFNKLLVAWVELLELPWNTVLGLRLQAGWADPWHRSAETGALGVPLEDRFFAGGGRSVRGYRENSLGPRISAQDTAAVGDVDILADRPASGGNALLLTNVELRFPIPLLSGIGLTGAVFADGGNVWKNWDDVSLGQFALTSDHEGEDATTVLDYRTSVGVGIHYNTPVGPLRLEYALPLRRAALPAEAPGTVEVDPQHLWHFSLGHAF